ncbi:unnamed protein product [Cyclocybe aegerita]|uniref:Uncharacterized protein n=1 Tax=Cyclocybe aegerita TaxID=1973307 RepID=A0A8S0WUB9_CYCAE|nr:unnamed protein product [Cyclocybe aegerita]
MSLEKVLKSMSALEPLPLDATPKTRKTFEKSLMNRHRLSGLIHMHTSGLLAASGIDVVNSQLDWTDPQIDNSGPTTAEARYDEIMEALDDPMFLPEEWLQPILKPMKGTFQQMEHQAFLHLVRGYFPAKSVEELGELFDGARGDDVNLLAFAASIALETNLDPTARLHAREAIMQSIDASDNSQSFVSSVIRSIQCLRFAAEWALLPSLPGGRLWKTQYRTDAFSKHNAEFVATDHTAQEFNKRFSAFTNRHERVITARNDLRRLFSVYGPAILMHPAWSPVASYNTSTTGRSTTFPGLLSLFLHGPPEFSQDYHEENDKAFKQLIKILLPT